MSAGNPPEYNKSVRDFDVVTLDRIKKIDVDVNYDVWKEYAYQADIHPAILHIWKSAEIISIAWRRPWTEESLQRPEDGKIFPSF